MIEKQGNFWAELGDAHVITTNGNVKVNGSCVMGRGIAREAKIMFPGIEFILGNAIKNFGNKVFNLGEKERKDGAIFNIFSFPVKHNWYDEADLVLIERSFLQLVEVTEKCSSIIIVRPGCGNGKLKWEVVRPIAKKYLDKRFKIVNLTK